MSTALIGVSASILLVVETVKKFANTAVNMVITGESGTGKELVAMMLHEGSQRATGKLVAVNCGAISTGIFESELFGHEKGSFTGAYDQRVGYLEDSNGGTLFLDEIGEMPLGDQPKLLRVLGSRKIRRVGGAQDIPVDFRLVAATNRDLAAMVQAGKFREDLLYRINVMQIVIPPLRERKEDIRPLAEFFIKKYSTSVQSVSAGALQVLAEHNWPGNVRELENVIQRAVFTCGGSEILEHHITIDGAKVATPHVEVPLVSFAEYERLYYCKMIEHCNGNISAIAKVAGLTNKTVYSNIRKYGLMLLVDEARKKK